MRFVTCMLLSLAMTGCGHRLVNVQPDAAAQKLSRQESGQPADSLETFMAKMRKLSAEAAPRPRAATLEAQDPRLGAAILAAASDPTPAALREVAQEYQRLGVLDRAHHYLNKALRLDARDAATHDALARLWRDAGFPHLGLGDAHRAVYYAPSSPIARNTLGTLLQALGRRDLARVEYERALELDATAAYALNNLCYGWVLEGNGPRAIAACTRALRLQPGFPAAHNNLALAHAVDGDMQAAREAFAATGDRAQALYNAGVVDLAQGRYRRAANAFAAATVERPALEMAAARERQALARVTATVSER